MADFILRKAEEKDTEQIVSIWCACFGDDGAFVREMLSRCGLIKNAVGAELEGRLRSCMFAFDGLHLGEYKASYIYAICTEPAYRSRGLGRAVTAFAADMAAQRGAELIFLRPANAELERWYSDALGAVSFARTTVENFVPCRPAQCKAEEISPEEYLLLRGEGIPLELLQAQDCIHRHYGGAFLSCEYGALCAEEREEGILVRELISDSPELALAAAAEYFKTEKLLLFSHGKAGSPLICVPPSLVPEKGEKLPFMPFTLD